MENNSSVFVFSVERSLTLFMWRGRFSSVGVGWFCGRIILLVAYHRLSLRAILIRVSVGNPLLECLSGPTEISKRQQGAVAKPEIEC